VAQLLPTPYSGAYYLDVGAIVDLMGMRTRVPTGALGADERWWGELLDLLGPLAGASGLPRDGWVQHTALIEIRW
jgi:hypothetical protein